MDEVTKYEPLVRKALAPLDPKTAKGIWAIVWPLFQMVYPDLEQAVEGNPIDHHLVVLGHMVEIAIQERSPFITMEQAIALALLHDISPVDKITAKMVASLREQDAAKADVLELKRQQNRKLHMREGSAMAHRRMLQFNESTGRIIFGSETIDAVCEVISIHDDPSLHIPIPRRNWLAVAFREADRLWMITDAGIRADLTRQGSKLEDSVAYRTQLNWNIDRFREERSLYRPIEPTEGPFCDDETFFRTKAGHTIYTRLCEEAEQRANKGKTDEAKR